jgi:hypothetical protein
MGSNSSCILWQHRCRNIYMTKRLDEVCSWYPSRSMTEHYNTRQQVLAYMIYSRRKMWSICKMYADSLYVDVGPTEVPHCSSIIIKHNKWLGQIYLFYFTCWLLDARIAGLNPAEVDGHLTTIEVRSKTSFVRGMKPGVPSHIFTPCKRTFLTLDKNTLFFISNSGGWSPTGWTRHVGHQLAYCTCPGWLWGWWIWWNDDWHGKSKYSEKTCFSATLSIKNPTCPDRSRNQRLTAWATARLTTFSHMMVYLAKYFESESIPSRHFYEPPWIRISSFWNPISLSVSLCVCMLYVCMHYMDMRLISTRQFDRFY